MIDHSPSPTLVAGSADLVPRAAIRAYLAVLAAVGASLTALMLVMSVAADTGSEAERIADTHGDGYAATLVLAIASNLSRPLR